MYNNYYQFPYNMGLTRNITPLAQPLLRSGAPMLTNNISPLTTAGATKSFSWSGILNGASKTLGVINQAIPVIYQVKPIINNAKTMFRVVKEINKPETNNTIKQTYQNDTKNQTITNNNINQPNFFI